MKNREHLEDLGVDGRIRKLILKAGWKGVAWIYLS
jgi:hypothetical protein